MRRLQRNDSQASPAYQLACIAYNVSLKMFRPNMRSGNMLYKELQVSSEELYVNLRWSPVEASADATT